MVGDGQEVGGGPGLLRLGRDGVNDGGSGIGDGRRAAGGEQLRPGNLRNRRAEEESRAGQMFGGVDLAFDAENFLGARDRHVVDELLPVMSETGTIACAGEFRHPGAARAAVQIEAELRAEAA